MPALVVGERRPAAAAQPGEVGVVLLARAGAVQDQHPRPGRRRRRRQPEQVRAPVVDAGSVAVGGGDAARARPFGDGAAPSADVTVAPQLVTMPPMARRDRRRSDLRLARVPARQPRQRARPPRGRRLRRGRARGRVRHARLHLRRGRHPRARPRPTSTRSGRAPTTSRCSTRARRRRSPRSTGCSPRRGSRSTSPPAASSTWRCAAGFDPARIYLHGNNKTEAELRYAIEAGSAT